MQKTLAIKLFIIAGLCLIFAIGLNIFSSVIYERQSYADTVIREIAEQHVNPQQVITPFIAIPTTVTPKCAIDAADKTSKCAAPYSKIETVFAAQTQARQDLKVSQDTYQRGIYHATSYNGELKFDQSYSLSEPSLDSSGQDSTVTTTPINIAEPTSNTNKGMLEQTTTHWDKAKLIIPVSDLRGVATLPTVTINKQVIKATYPLTPLIHSLTYVEVALPETVISQLSASVSAQPSDANAAIKQKDQTILNDSIKVVIELALSGISAINTVPTGNNFELTMQSNWYAPNFIGKALPNAKSFSADGFEASWQNQYITVANNQYLTQCLSAANNRCSIVSNAFLQVDSYAPEAAIAVADASIDNTTSVDNVSVNSFGVSFAEPNDVYLQTERTMKYALLLILVSFGTFFLFEIIKSSRIHPIQYLLVGCALLVFYVLLLPLAEQIAFWQAYAIAASSCVGLIGWYTYYVLGSVKRAIVFTAILAGLYAAFYGILTTEDMNLLLGAVFCFILLACVMVMTRKIDWYKVA